MNAIKPKVMSWTEEEMQKLRDLCKTGGLTTREMAEKFGITKSALIGKKNRMGLTRPENNPMKNHTIANATRKSSTAKKRLKIKRARETLLSGYDVDAPKMPNGTGCRFIAGEPLSRPAHMDVEDMFCGQKLKKDSSYCDHHHARCYIPKKKKPKVEGAGL